MWGDGPRLARGARVGRCALFQESRVSGITGPGLKSAGRARTFQNINSARPSLPEASSAAPPHTPDTSPGTMPSLPPCRRPAQSALAAKGALAGASALSLEGTALKNPPFYPLSLRALNWIGPRGTLSLSRPCIPIGELKEDSRILRY